MSKIFLDDPNALQMCLEKLSKLEKEKAYWKNLKPEKRTFQNETDNMKRVFMLPNCNARINDLKKKIKKIQSLQENNIKLERKEFFRDGKKLFKYEAIKND